MIKIYAIISFLACVLANTCSAYQLIGTAALSEELVAQHYTINPNLDAVIVVDRTTPTFEYHTFYGAGSADEVEGQQGRIHFLEHVIAGIGGYPPGKLIQIIADNKGEQRAFTNYHFTRFILKFPKDKFDLTVEIDRDRFYNTVINDEVVEQEKKIILTETSRNATSPNRRLSNYFLSLIYKKKNFSILGDEAFIKQIESHDLKAYYKNFLRLQKRLIVVIGDVDVDHVLMKLDEAYGNVKDQKPRPFHSDPQYPNSEVLGKKFNITSKDLSVSKFWKSWYTPCLGHRDYAGLLILTHILNKSSNSLKSSMVDFELAKAFTTELHQLKGFSLMSCVANLPHDTSVDTIEAIIRAELERIKSQGISEEELNGARNQQLRKMYSKFYDASSIAHSFGQAFAHANDPLLYPKLIKDIESIHKKDIPRIINQYLTSDNSVTASLILPAKSFGYYLLFYGTIATILFFFVCLVWLLVWTTKRLYRKFS